MAALFLKIKKDFKISNKEDERAVAEQHAELDFIRLDISVYKENTPSLRLSIYSNMLESGNMITKLESDQVVVSCDFVAKINIRPEYVEELLNPDAKWEFLNIDKLYGKVIGLEVEEYEYKNRFGSGISYRYYIPVKTAKKIKELS